MDDRETLELLQAMVRAQSHPAIPRQEEGTALRPSGLPPDVTASRASSSRSARDGRT